MPNNYSYLPIRKLIRIGDVNAAALLRVCSILCLLCILTTSTKLTNQNGCTLNVVDFGTNSPIFLRKSHKWTFNLAMPNEGSLRLRPGENVTIACPNVRNFLTATQTNQTVVTCTHDNTLGFDKRNIIFEELECHKSIRGEIVETNQTCGPSARIIHIGYSVGRKNFLKLIEVCYDATNGNTRYTQHSLDGAEIKFASKSNYRPGFNTAGLGKDIAAAVAYKQTFQKATFNKLFTSAKTANNYINDENFLVRGHLAPDADFILAPWQHITYFYVNVCPQWRSINGGNWKSLEITVRKTAEIYGNIFRITTGTYGVLTLPDDKGTAREIFLTSNERLPVPKYLWKIVYDENTRSAIVLIILNNPFGGQIGRRQDLLCRSICEEHGWSGSNAWRNTTKGFIHCCDFQQFINVVPNVPHLSISGILRGPK